MPFDPTLATWLNLNAANFTSPTGLTDVRTGQPQFGGALYVGKYFDLTEAEANQLSTTATGTLHTGRYRFVQVDSAATASNVKTGTIGCMASLAQGVNVVTSFDKKLGAGLHQVVFLNAITPGNYGFVQEAGDANVLFGGTATGSAGTLVYATSLGVGTSTAGSDAPIGRSEATLSTTALNRVQLDLPLIQG